MTCVLVTGATGFIGSYLCRELIKQGVYVKVLLRENTSGEWHRSFVCNLDNQQVPAKAMQDVDVVFHLAGRAHALDDGYEHDSLYFKTNVDGTRALLETAKLFNVDRFIFFSSVKAMGEECSLRLDENTTPNPISVYGKSKLEAEKLVLYGRYIKRPVVLRLPMVYGNTQKGNLPKMIKAISRDCFPPMPKTINYRSMVHVQDVVNAAILAAGCNRKAGQLYIITDGIDYSTRNLYEIILKEMNKKVPSWGMPVFLLKVIAKIGDVVRKISGKRILFDTDNFHKLFGNSYFSSDKIKSELGFMPKHDLYKEMPKIISNLKLNE